nr:MAG: hypothetical protein DIU78_05095 [Pseudomonadota bacterium]
MERPCARYLASVAALRKELRSRPPARASRAGNRNGEGLLVLELGVDGEANEQKLGPRWDLGREPSA